MASAAAKSAAASLSSPAMRWAAGGWTLFIAENLILSENRTYLISALGDDGYHGLYGTLSTAAVGSILYGYRYKVRAAGPFAFPVGARPSPGSLAASFVLQALALGMASQSLPKLQVPVQLTQANAAAGAGAGAATATSTTHAAAAAPPTKREWKVRCPFDFTDSRSQTAVASGGSGGGTRVVELHGLDRISRHPGLWSFGLLGVGNALLVPSIPTRVWLSMPLLVALIGGGHTDSRLRRGMGGQLSPDVDAVTSNIPFAAMLMGKQEGGGVVDSFVALGGEVKVLNAAVAAGAAALWVARRGRGGAPASTSSVAAGFAR